MTYSSRWLIVAASLTAWCATAHDVTHVRHIGPLTVMQPVAIDSTGMKADSLSQRDLLDTPIAPDMVWRGETWTLADCRPMASVQTAQDTTAKALHLLGFTVESTSYQRVSLTVTGLTGCRLYVDGAEQRDMSRVELLPTHHTMVLKYLTHAADTMTPSIQVTSLDSVSLSVGDGSTPHLPTLDEMFTGWRYANVTLSPDGRWYTAYKYSYQPGGDVLRRYELRDARTDRLVSETLAQWMPEGGEYYHTRQEPDKSRTLVATDAATGREQTLATHLPGGDFTVAPGGHYLVFTVEEKGPAKQQGVAEVLNPEDRQPDWRTRRSITLYDVATGISHPLTFGYRQTWLADISRQGDRLLLAVSDYDFTVRPSQRTSWLMVTLPHDAQGDITLSSAQPLQVDTLVWRDGFVNEATFSPDGRQLLLRGSAEALGRVGCTLPADRTPNGFEYQLYVMDLEAAPLHDSTTTARRPVRPLTRDFQPSVTEARWSAYDGMLYLLTEDRDYRNAYRMNPTTQTAQRLAVPVDAVRGMTLADDAPVMMCYGESATHGPRLYRLDTRHGTKKGGAERIALVEDLAATHTAQWKTGTYHAWTYDNGRGDSITCGYCLPADFDPTRRYPVIVHYYGGCSPTSRYFTGSYSPQLYAAHGYIALVVNPSGAAGFGQEFASRHVGTAGRGVAEDIIGASQTFCRTHAFADSTRVGCISASYGGFMTQYMLTLTDFFATGVSHAGISSHAGYWGEGYWGYSYSEVSMGDRYPWTDPSLYVDQSPLFRADRIHRPLLLTHGTADTNVPPSESIQMFTALKRTGCPTALLMVDGENHGISDYKKRAQWLHAIMAWFDRWLKDEPAWWDSMYPEQKL